MVNFKKRQVMNEERILNQLSDHEKTLTLMSKVVEDINKNLDRFGLGNIFL